MQDAEVDDRVHLHADVVPGDDVLRRHVQHDRAQADPHHAVDGPGHQRQPRALGRFQEVAQTEDDGPLVLVQDLDGEEQPEDEHDGDDHPRLHQAPFRTRSVSPSTEVTVTWSPGPTGASATPRQRSPSTRTQPSGASGVSATPCCPTRPLSPVTGTRRWAWITRRTSRMVPAAITAAAGSGVAGGMRTPGS